VIVQEGLRSTDKVALIDPFVKDEPQKQ